MRVILHPGYEEALKALPEVNDALAAAADAVVNDAQVRAPKASGEGAASIHKEKSDEGYRVSWDPTFFYMRFHELGTEHEPARPFLRPAADAPGRTN